jgi:hypothetical protein
VANSGKLSPGASLDLDQCPSLARAIASAPSSGFAQSKPSPTQSDQDHGAHQPATSDQQTATPPPRRGMPMGMLDQDGQAGMMNADQEADDVDDAQQMMTMMSAESGMMPSHVEGRIASLKSDLKITEAQPSQWDHFADALRATAKSMNGMYQQMTHANGAATLPARLETQEQTLSAHLASLEALKAALNPLYTSLSNEQRKRATG